MVNIKTLSQSYPITKYSDTLEPTWGPDTGRNSNSGKFSGTFIGYFTTIHIDFGRTTKNQMQELKAIFVNPIIEDVTFPDSYSNVYKTEDFYGTAIKAELNKWNGLYEPFSIDLIGLVKRNDI